MGKTKNICLFQIEKAQSLAIINLEELNKFLFLYADEYVGRKTAKNGELVQTLLKEEIGEVARLTHMAYIADEVDYYSRKAMSMAELGRDVTKSNSERMYMRAGKKLLFLNCVAKGLNERGFINKKIDKDSLVEVQKLVDAFEWCIRHYYVMTEED